MPLNHLVLHNFACSALHHNLLNLLPNQSFYFRLLLLQFNTSNLTQHFLNAFSKLPHSDKSLDYFNRFSIEWFGHPVLQHEQADYSAEFPNSNHPLYQSSSLNILRVFHSLLCDHSVN